MNSSLSSLARVARSFARRPILQPAKGFLALLLSIVPAALGQTITWDGGGGDLDWNNRLNWSGDAIPDAANDVVIVVAPGATVLCPSGARIKSVQCNANLLLSGGTLTVTAGISAIEGSLTVASGASVVGSGPDVHLRAIGGAQIDGASLQAYDGAVVEVPGIGQVNAFNSMSWLAEGAGSRLSLPGLTNLIGSTSPWFRLSATSGGRLELTNLVSISDGYVAVYAEGDNSMVDLSAVESFQPTNGQMNLTAYNNGAIRMPLVTDGRAIHVDRRAGGQIPVTQYFRLGNFTQFGGSAVLSGLTSLESLSGLYAYAGAVVEVPGIGRVNAHNSMSWLAEGAGSRLILPGLTNLIGAPSPWFRLSATAGGRLELTNLVSISDGYVAVYAEGENSVMDLSAVESFQPTNGQMNLAAYNNGAIRMPLVTDGRAIHVDRRFGGQIPVAQYFRLGSFTQFGGSAVLSGLTSLEGLNGLSAYAGAVVEVPGIGQVNAHSSMTWLAEGAGSRLSLPGLTNLIGAPSPWFRLSATAGGRLELTNVVSIPDGYVAVHAEGENSVVDLSAVESFQPTNGQMNLTAYNNGAIRMPLVTDGRAIHVDRRSGGQIPVTQYFRLGSFTQFGGTTVLSGLTSLESLSGLYAYAGAVVEVPGIGQVNAHNSMSWWAEGAGSRLSLPGLTNLIGATSPWFRLSATSGGRLELTNVVSIPDGYVAVHAEGENSVVDLSAVESFQPTNGQMNLTAYNNGAIRMPLVTDGRAIHVDRRSGGQIPVTQYFRLGSFTQFGGSAVLSGLTSLEGLNGLSAYAGAVVDVPGIGQVNAHSSVTWLAEGAGSRLSLPGLTNLIGAPSPWFRLSATSGGRLELTNLVSIPDGYVAVHAEGENSVVDLSAVESFQPTNGQMNLTAYNNGAIRMPLVTDGRAIHVDRRSGGQIPVTQYFRLGSFTQFGGTTVLSGLTSLESLSGLYAYAGAVVEVPGIGQVNAHNSMSWWAEGAGSRLSLPGLTNLIGAPSPWFRLSATSGGRLELTNLTSISDGYVAVYASGENSVVDAHRLSGFVAKNGQGLIESTSGGAILLNEQGWLTANLSINIPAGNPVLPSVLAVTPTLKVHGRAWRSYWLETKDTSRAGSPWVFAARVPLTNDTQVLAESPRANTAYRIREFVAEEPILDLRHFPSMEVQLVLYGTPSKAYEIQFAEDMDSPPAGWNPGMSTGSMTNSFRIFESFEPSEDRRFYRGREL